MLGQGTQNLTWPRAVIRRVADLLKPGTKLFSGHNEDNSTSGRKSVGEVITKYTKEIGGRLRTIAIACMTKVDAALYDICSIEALVHADNGLVGDVDQVTGIAVSNSKIETPAFSNAKRMQLVQCFDSQVEPVISGKEKSMITLEDLMTAPIGLIQQAVNARQIHPGQLFDAKAFENDNEVGKIIKERNEFKTAVDVLTKEVADSKGLLTAAEKKASVSTASELLKARMPKGLTEKQVKFAESRFKPEEMELVNEETVDAFIKQSQEGYQEMAKLFGNEEDTTTTDNETETDLPAGDKSITELVQED